MWHYHMMFGRPVAMVTSEITGSQGCFVYFRKRRGKKVDTQNHGCFWRKVDELGMVELVFFVRDWDPMGFITILQEHLGEWTFGSVFQAD